MCLFALSSLMAAEGVRLEALLISVMHYKHNLILQPACRVVSLCVTLSVSLGSFGIQSYMGQEKVQKKNKEGKIKPAFKISLGLLYTEM